MRVETNKLTGSALVWAVAEIEGWEPYLLHHPVRKDFFLLRCRNREVSVPLGGAEVMPIIDREVHTLIKRDGQWEAEVFWPKPPHQNRFCYALKGPDAITASMRTFVASRRGAEVDVPGELMKENR